MNASHAKPTLRKIFFAGHLCPVDRKLHFMSVTLTIKTHLAKTIAANSPPFAMDHGCD
jgi:hypothetical protein